MERSQPHFGAIADQNEDKGGFEPRSMRTVRGKGSSLGNEHAYLIERFRQFNSGFIKGHGKKDIPEQGQGNAHRTDHEIFPGGLKRTLVTVEVDEGSA